MDKAESGINSSRSVHVDETRMRFGDLEMVPDSFADMSTACAYAREIVERNKRMAEIGLALSSERRLERIFELVVEEARRLTHADAGTLYIVTDDGEALEFVVMQNESMRLRMGGTSGNHITLPPVALHGPHGAANHNNVSSYVALTGRAVSIPDVYEAEGFDFTGTRAYDATTGYRSRSMLVMAMKNHEGEIIGVLQLLNAMDGQGKVRSFDDAGIGVVAALASQAAVALTNVQLVRDLKRLLYSFIKSIASVIDAKSPYTRGHIDRVVKLTMLMAQAVNMQEHGPLGDVTFSEDELEEIKLAAWMHDVGKIVTPEHVVDKSSKLQTIFNRIELIRVRFQLIGERMRVEALEKRLEMLRTGADPEQGRALEKELESLQRELWENFDFVKACNESTEYMSDQDLARLQELAARTYCQGGELLPWLTPNELENLSVRMGTLTPRERRIVEDHVVVTQEMLAQLPFPRRLSRVPLFAGRHHEKLDGSGYPDGLSGDDLPLQARILAIADIFEALTAKDRPYKKPMMLSDALRILGQMRKQGYIDPDIYELFVRERVYAPYVLNDLEPSQVDEVP
ncbi:MAG: HD domain-containing phosphohydrolase [Desulfovibrio sp.]